MINEKSLWNLLPSWFIYWLDTEAVSIAEALMLVIINAETGHMNSEVMK
jgi:hypothetical protein